MKILFLDFRNAGWFFKVNYDDTDYVFNIGHQTQPNKDGVSGIKRVDYNKRFKEPITVHQISNVLHVLFGERPSASLRETAINPIPEIKEIARSGWLKIDPYYFVAEKQRKIIFSEKLRTKKAVWNSWNPTNPKLSWSMMERFLGQPLYQDLLEVVRENIVSTDPINTCFDNIVEELHNKYFTSQNVKLFVDKLKKHNKTPLFNAILKVKESKLSAFNARPATMLTTFSGISELVRLSGKIIIPIENEFWVDKMKNSQGVAKILDGGLVTINRLVSEYDFSEEHIDGFTKISDISDEIISKNKK